MKKISLCLIASFAILLFSCKDNAFDFSRLHSLDAEGRWGIPVADVQYAIEDVLNKADNIPLHVSPEGMLQLEYATEVDSVISSDQILHSLSNQQVNLHGTQSINIPTLPPMSGTSITLFSDTLTAELPSDKIIVESARIKSGVVLFSLTHTCPATLTAELLCQQLIDANGEAFSQTITIQGNNENQISLSGYTLAPESNNRLKFVIRISLTTTGEQLPNSATLAYGITVGNFDLEEFSGKVAPISIDVNRNINLRLGYIAKTMGGSFTVYNPDIRCEVHNMFPIGASILLNEAVLSGPNVQAASLIATTPVTVTVPAATPQFEEIPLPISPSLTFSPKMNEAHLSANVTFNPEGFNTPTMTIREGEYIHFRISFKLPLHLKMNNVTFCDTIPFNQVDFPDIDGIHNMAIRCLFENGLPLDLFGQVYFYDTETQTLQDSLFDQTQLLIGSYGQQPSISEAYITKENFKEVRQLLNCDKIIIKATIDTDEHQVCIRNDQKLRLRLGAKFNLDTRPFINF